MCLIESAYLWRAITQCIENISVDGAAREKNLFASESCPSLHFGGSAHNQTQFTPLNKN